MGTLEVICGPMFSGCRKCFSPAPRPATAPPEQELFPFLKRAGPQGS
ncbi:MAG TPA: hypothetical protein VEQ15_07850 [Myxococcales bacterium]|jgi:hypothetical protein|nr:hypothetical protein [Myxococcales bacterium]